MDETTREDLGRKSWEIDEYHRGIKQFCGVEKCFRKKHGGEIFGEVLNYNFLSLILGDFYF
jgi:hypothetical protein